MVVKKNRSSLTNSMLGKLAIIISVLFVFGCLAPENLCDFDPPYPTEPNPPFDISVTPEMNGRISDYFGLIDTLGKERIINTLDSLENRGVADIYVLIIPTLPIDEVSEYAEKVFNSWSDMQLFDQNSILISIVVNNGAINIVPSEAFSKSLSQKKLKKMISTSMSKPFSDGRFVDGLVYISKGMGNTLVDEHPEPVHGYRTIVRNVVYPEVAREMGIEETVILAVLVGASGNVLDTKVLEGTEGDDFAISAENAVRKTYWKPAMHNGIAFKMWISVPVVFRLR